MPSPLRDHPRPDLSDFDRELLENISSAYLYAPLAPLEPETKRTDYSQVVNLYYRLDDGHSASTCAASWIRASGSLHLWLGELGT